MKQDRRYLQFTPLKSGKRTMTFSTVLGSPRSTTHHGCPWSSSVHDAVVGSSSTAAVAGDMYVLAWSALCPDAKLPSAAFTIHCQHLVHTPSHGKHIYSISLRIHMKRFRSASSVKFYHATRENSRWSISRLEAFDSCEQFLVFLTER